MTRHSVEYALTQYIGLSKRQAEKVFNSRDTYWSIINKDPLYCMTQNKLYFICNYLNKKFRLIGTSKTLSKIYKGNVFIKGE